MLSVFIAGQGPLITNGDAERLALAWEKESMGGTLGALLLPVLGEMAPEDLRRCLGGVWGEPIAKVPCGCIENPLWVIQWEWVVGAVLGLAFQYLAHAQTSLALSAISTEG